MRRLKQICTFMLLVAATITTVAVSAHDGIRDFVSDIPEIYYAAVSPVIAMNNYSGKYHNQLYRTLFNDMEVWGDITTHTGLKSKLTFTELEVSDGARPYVGQEQLSGDDLKYTGTVLEVELGQRDFQLEIRKYYKTHLEEALNKAEGSGANLKRLPFAVETINTVTGRLRAELNDKTAYFGFDKADAETFVPGDTYEDGDYMQWSNGTTTDYYLCLADTTAGQTPVTHPAKWKKVNAEAICPGFRHHLDALIAASKVTPVTIGAINNTSVFAYASHKKLFRSHTEAYQKAGVVHYCSYTDFQLLLDDIEDKVAKYTEKDSNWTVDGRGIYLPQTNRKCTVIPCTWMSGTRRILSTPKANLHGGTDRTNDNNEIKTRDKDNYNTVTSVTFTLGFQIQDPKALRVNDQA